MQLDKTLLHRTASYRGSLDFDSYLTFSTTLHVRRNYDRTLFIAESIVWHA